MANDIEYKLIHWPKEDSGAVWFVRHRSEHEFTPIIQTPCVDLEEAAEWLRKALQTGGVYGIEEGG
jgi:hypothetical protein